MMEFLGSPVVLGILIYLLYGMRVANLCHISKGELSTPWWVSLSILWLPLFIVAIICIGIKKP